MSTTENKEKFGFRSSRTFRALTATVLIACFGTQTVAAAVSFDRVSEPSHEQYEQIVADALQSFTGTVLESPESFNAFLETLDDDALGELAGIRSVLQEAQAEFAATTDGEQKRGPLGWRDVNGELNHYGETTYGAGANVYEDTQKIAPWLVKLAVKAVLKSQAFKALLKRLSLSVYHWYIKNVGWVLTQIDAASGVAGSTVSGILIRSGKVNSATANMIGNAVQRLISLFL